MKRCTKCGQYKPATSEYFHSYKRSPDGRRSVCKVCRALDHAEHREDRARKKKQHYLENREKLLCDIKRYYKNNSDEQKRLARERYHQNREHNLVRMRNYRLKNVDELNARRRPRAAVQWKNRYGKDLNFTLKHRLKSLVRVSLKNGRKGKRLYDLLGYTSDELRTHLENQFVDNMCWESFMNGEIHIDHKIPVSSFNITSVDSPDFKKCWALSNLQPLWAFDNLSKGTKVLQI